MVSARPVEADSELTQIKPVRVLLMILEGEWEKRGWWKHLFLAKLHSVSHYPDCTLFWDTELHASRLMTENGSPIRHGGLEELQNTNLKLGLSVYHWRPSNES